MDTLTLGDLIRSYREQNGFTQEELADIVQVSCARLSNWETGNAIPRPSMVARLSGALGLSDSEVDLLKNAAETARAMREQENLQKQLEVQKQQFLQEEEEERLLHQDKAIKLLLMGLGGFVCGIILGIVVGDHRDFWFTTLLLGYCFSGVPFGWKVLFKDPKAMYSDYPYPETYIIHTNIVVQLIVWLLKLMGAVLVGFFAYPIVLLFHAYKAGRKGSVYRIIMGILFLLSAGIVGILIVGSLI